MGGFDLVTSFVTVTPCTNPASTYSAEIFSFITGLCTSTVGQRQSPDAFTNDNNHVYRISSREL